MSGHGPGDLSGAAGRTLRVALTDNVAPEAWESRWRALEGSASFFTSWNWVGPLLGETPTEHRPAILSVLDGDQIVALMLLGRSIRRRRWIRSRTLHINETGNPALDAVTLEHNDIVCSQAHRPQVTQAVMQWLARRPDWDELDVGALSPEAYRRWQLAGRECGLTTRELWTKDHHFVELAAVRQQAGGFLALLSANTRQQIRRSMKHYAQRGELRMARAASEAEALAWLDGLAALHQPYWQAQGQPGAFGTDFQRRFHREVVMRGWPQGAVELVRVSAGDAVLGYAYNFSKDGVLCNYQTGLAYEQDQRLKPGLVCHALIAEDAAQRGLARYDMLMGGGHYKQRISNGSGSMTWCLIQQPRLALRAESLLRSAAQRLRRMRAQKPAGTAGTKAEEGV